MSTGNILKTPITDSELSKRTINCLTREGVERCGDLLTYKNDDILRIKNLGRKGYDEICNLRKKMVGDFNE